MGGGVAGMAAAIRLAEAGRAVTLIETRRKLGGRATSFADVRSGEVLDNCQHIVLGCCTAYLDLLARLGTDRHITWYDEQYWVEPGGRVSTVKPSAMPAPLHLSWSMLRAPFLSMGQLATIGRACMKIMRVDRSRYEDVTFARFLEEAGQGPEIQRRFWTPIVVSACNLDPERVVASAALQVFQEGFFAATKAASMGVPDVPLVGLYERVTPMIEAAGGRVLLGTSAERLERQRVHLKDGTAIDAETVICALPFERVGAIVDDATRAADDRFSMIEHLTHSPILGVHLFFDRPVMRLPHATLVERPTHWLFRKDNAGQRLHAVISGADEWMPLTESEIGERVLDDVRACFPDARDAACSAVRAVKEKRATFAAVPGFERFRPAPEGPSGVIMAGDYTITGWPATMEGATRSGYAAAAIAMGEPSDAFDVPPLPVARVAGWLGIKPTVVSRALSTLDHVDEAGPSSRAVLHR